MIDKRTTEELFLRYELEPSLRDVFVEGEFDASVVKWLLHEKSLHHVAVFEIDSIHVGDELLRTLGLTAHSNRNRVIALGILFSNQHPSGNQLTCIVDADFDYARPQKTLPECILATDFASLDIYFFDEKPVSKFFSLVRPGFSKPASILIEEILAISHEIFLVRMANEQLGWGCHFLEFERCLSIDGKTLKFDSHEYIDRYLAKSSRSKHKKDFILKMGELRKSLHGDLRFFVNGHDVLGCLIWAITKLGKRNGLAAQALVENGLIGCIELEDLEQHTLFKRLLARVAERSGASPIVIINQQKT